LGYCKGEGFCHKYQVCIFAQYINQNKLTDLLKMEIENIIFQNEDVKIVLELLPNDDAIKLLKKSIYGTNGPKYIHTGQEVKTTNLKKPLFFRLIKDEKTIGFYCLCKRIISSNQGIYDGFYGRYLAVDSAFQGKKYGNLLKNIAVEYVEKNEEKPLVFYSYIEENNVKSLNISKREGFTSIATLKTTLFTRISPKANERLEQIKTEEVENFKVLLTQYFSKYSLLNLENINYQNNYFVIRHQGEIVAGLQANPVEWKIVEMEGFSGKILMNVLPYLPVLKKIFNPNTYQFLAVEGVYLKAGHEHELYPLIEGVLNHFSIYSALFQLDSHDFLIKKFNDNKNLGILNAIKKDITTHVMVKTHEISTIKNNDEIVYVSSFDFT
jgi:RimJ/RimL family protein N-acetyltransferase